MGRFADLLLSPEPIQNAAHLKEGLPGVEKNAQWYFVSSKLPGDAALKEEGYWTHWNAIFNSSFPHIDANGQKNYVWLEWVTSVLKFDQLFL